ncbi:MAG: 3-oxoadipyl-CoA thiolase [Proteobacteria bacterium]|nr:3-oxoadipyl-CoA thiolase [Pseudomonadota bacterium]
MLDAYIYDGVRTPFGRHAGAIARVRPDELLATTIRAIVERNPFAPEDVEDVIIGCANQAGEDSRNVARHAGLLAGVAVEAGAITVNRLCGSGLAAVLDAARAVTCGQGALFVAGGVESMSRAPFVIGKAEGPFARNAKMFDSTLGARFPNPEIEKQFGADTMGETAENVGRDLDIGRDESDRFAEASQGKYQKAKEDGFYDEEILSLLVPMGRKAPPAVIAEDEHPRPGTTFDKLQALKPLFAGGTVTAGNASGINDGAAALLIGARSIGEEAGVKPRARILSGAVAGVPPRVMGLGPAPASAKALERAGLALADMDVIEINEAFAIQVLGCLKQMQLSADDGRLNPNGGAIALGHPLGASGARLTLTSLRQLERTGGRYALVSMCIGVGQGIAAVIERV